MSLENHPNFHAVKFATDVTVAFHELQGKEDEIVGVLVKSFQDCLRGGGKKIVEPDSTNVIRTFVRSVHSTMPMREEVGVFVLGVESWVDKLVERKDRN